MEFESFVLNEEQRFQILTQMFRKKRNQRKGDGAKGIKLLKRNFFSTPLK